MPPNKQQKNMIPLQNDRQISPQSPPPNSSMKLTTPNTFGARSIRGQDMTDDAHIRDLPSSSAGGRYAEAPPQATPWSMPSFDQLPSQDQLNRMNQLMEMMNKAARSGHKFGKVTAEGNAWVQQGNLYDDSTPGVYQLRTHEYGPTLMKDKSNLTQGDMNSAAYQSIMSARLAHGAHSTAEPPVASNVSGGRKSDSRRSRSREQSRPDQPDHE